MKNLVIAFLILVNTAIQAQDTLKLKINNPQPRVGESVDLSFSMSFFADEIALQLDTGIKITNEVSMFISNPDIFGKTLIFNNIGQYIIGPFEFDFNSKHFVTDSIIVNVAPKLPMEEGVWVRYVESNGTKYIILEQLIRNKSDLKKKKDGYSYTVGGKMDKKDEFVELVEEPENGVHINSNYSSKSNKIDKNADPTNPGFSYSYVKYEISSDESYKGVFKLRKKYFTNLPKKAKIEEIEIVL